MEVIIKTLDEWCLLLKRINELRREYGYDIFIDAISGLESMKENKWECTDKGMLLINTLFNHGITDLDVAINFLDSIKSFYDFENVINGIPNLANKYGVDKLAFINNFESADIKVNTFINSARFRKVYMPKYASDIVPFLDVNLKSNGLDTVKVTTFDPFIVDAKDLADKNSDFNERVYYTGNFNFRCETLPLKEEMNIFRIQQEKELSFKSLIDYLQFVRAKVQLEVANPNQEYSSGEVIDLASYTSIRSDGVVWDINCEQLFLGDNGTIFYKVLVRDANFVLLANIKDETVDSVRLIIKEDYLNSIRDEGLLSVLNSFNKESAYARS